MVQSALGKRVLEVILRIILIVVAFGIGAFFFSNTIHGFVLDTLKYQIPNGFFGFTFADWDVAWFISSSFWIGIIFGTIGKKIDYYVVFLFFILFSFDFFYTENMTSLVYSGLVGATILGNLIGYMLKIGRQNYFAKK